MYTYIYMYLYTYNYTYTLHRSNIKMDKTPTAVNP